MPRAATLSAAAVILVPTSPSARPALAPPAIPYWETFVAVAGDRAEDRAAQVWAESRFRPNAVSPVGARGIAQFMPGTWEEAKRRGWVKPDADPFDPVEGIKANHGYMVHLEGRYRAEPDPRRRWRLGLGAYNAGPRSIDRALQRAAALGVVAEDPWTVTLPSVTGHHAAETIGYLRAIVERRRLYGKVPR